MGRDSHLLPRDRTALTATTDVQQITGRPPATFGAIKRLNVKLYFDLFLTLNLLISGLQSHVIKYHLYALNCQYLGVKICHKCVMDTLVHLLYMEVSSVTVTQEGLVKDIVIRVIKEKAEIRTCFEQ